MCAALFVVWRFLRNVYGAWASAIAVLSLFGFSYLILIQNTEARFYGLLLALVAFAAFEYQALCNTYRPSRILLMITGLTHIALVLTHVFGFVYSGLIIGALFLYDLQTRRVRWRLYVFIGLSWLVFTPWIIPLKIQAEVMPTYTWVKVPDLADLVNLYGSDNLAFMPNIVLFTLLIAVILTRARRPRGGLYLTRLPTRMIATTSNQLAILTLGVLFLIVPIVIFIISNLGRSLFVARYMLPSIIGWGTVIAHLAYLLTPSIRISSTSRKKLRAIMIFPVSVVVLALLFPLMIAVSKQKPVPVGTYDNIYGYPDLPILTITRNDYLTRTFYVSNPNRYFFALDMPMTLSKKAPLDTLLDYNTLNAIKGFYPRFGGNVIDTDEFLQQHPRFLLINEPTYPWYDMRIKNNPYYVHTVLGQTDGPEYIPSPQLILIERLDSIYF